MASLSSASKRRALDVLNAKRLRKLVDICDARPDDRRLRDDLIRSLADGRRVDFTVVVNELKRTELKAMCEALDLDPVAKTKSLLVDRILGGEGGWGRNDRGAGVAGFFRRYDVGLCRGGSRMHPASHQREASCCSPCYTRSVCLRAVQTGHPDES